MRDIRHQGRPKEHDTNAVMDAATLSFWQKGYDGCSLHDLMESTGLSKSSFYQSFGNKKQMFIMTLVHYSEREILAMEKNIKAAVTGYGFFEALVESFVTKTASHWKAGCLIANTSSEFGQNDPEIGAALTTAIDNYVRTFASAITKGQDDGSISKAQPPGDLAHYLMVTLNGLRTMVKVGIAETQLRKAGDMILKTLK